MTYAEKIVGKTSRGDTVLLQHRPGESKSIGKYGQCSTDVFVILRRAGAADKEKVPSVKPGGKNGRYDLLSCTLPGWTKRPYWGRVLGWYFLNKRHLSWKEFMRKEKTSNGWRYVWQVNHLEGPGNCCLASLELESGEHNRSHYEANARRMYGSVFRRPAASSA